jgi:hypothetical protein
MPTGFPDYYGGLTLPVTVAQGGTGQTSITSKAMLYGAGTSKLIETNVGVANEVLQINSVTLVPTFQDLVIDASHMTGIVPIVNGGTGTATPALVAGTAVSITGTWPNNTINNTSAYASLADPLPVAHGGTGEALSTFSWDSFGNILSAAGLGAGSAWNLYDTNSHSVILAYVDGTEIVLIPTLHLTNPLAVIYGGTGSAAGALVATSGFITAPVAGGTSNGIKFGATAAQIALYDDGAGAPYIDCIGSNTNIGLIIRCKGTGVVRIEGGGLHIDTPLAVAYGGTGAASFAAAGLPAIVAKVNLTGQTGNITDTTLLTPSAVGFYRVSVEIYLNGSVLTGDGVTVQIQFTQNSFTSIKNPISYTAGTNGPDTASGSMEIYADASSNIVYNTSVSLSAGGAYDLRIRLEAL